jgi:hypothetical protein
LALSICNPADTPHTSASLKSATTAPAPPQQQGQAQTPQQPQKDLQKILPPGVNPNKLPQQAQQQLQDLLPQLPQLPDLPQIVNPNATGSSSGSPTDNLLNFLLGQ